MWTVMLVPPLRLACVMEIPGPDARRWRKVYETEAEALAHAVKSNRILAKRASELADKQERVVNQLAIGSGTLGVK